MYFLVYNKGSERGWYFGYNKSDAPTGLRGIKALRYMDDDFNGRTLASPARYFKQNEKGVAAMCKMLEEMRNEAAKEAMKQAEKDSARRLLKLGKITMDDLSECFPALSDGEIKELGAEVLQLI